MEEEKRDCKIFESDDGYENLPKYVVPRIAAVSYI